MMNKLTAAVLTTFLLTGCDRMLLGPEEKNSPTEVFDYIWNDFDQLYGLFEVKKINWDSLYTVYRPMVNENSGEEELYAALTGLLGSLDDNHITLQPSDRRFPAYQSGILGRLKGFTDFNFSVVQNNYLTEYHDLDQTIMYGKCRNNIGYIRICNFSGDRNLYSKEMDRIFTELADTRGVIIDVRNNQGGNPNYAIAAASHFAEERTLVLADRCKNGKNPADFTDWRYFYLEPSSIHYAHKAVLLTHRFTLSAGEDFTLAMKRIPHVTTIGDTTSGVFSTVVGREAPNGWQYSVTVGDCRNYEKISFEGVGIAPDILVKNDSADVAGGKDAALERAVELLSN